MNYGERGIWRRIHGGFSAMAEQAKDPQYSKEDAKNDIKWLATSDGLPTITRKIKFKGKLIERVEPKRMRDCNDAEVMIIWNTMSALADERELYLYEYDEKEIPFRSVGGRTRKEMELYIADLEKKGDIEYAKILRQSPTKKKTDAEEIVTKVFRDVEIF